MTLGHPIGASSIPVGIGYPEGNSVPLGGRFPKKGSAHPWHTTFRESLVCYTFMEMMTAKSTGHLFDVCCTPGVLARKVALSVGNLSNRKRLTENAKSIVCQPFIIIGTKGYRSSRPAAATRTNTTAAPARGCPSHLLPASLPDSPVD